MNIYNYQRISQNSRVGDLWMHAYKTIININKAIELGTEGISPEIDRVIGENYYLRALHYLYLCNIFGTPYVNNPTRPNSGIPLKLTSNPDEYPSRSTVKEIYERLVKDLEKAIELMDLEHTGLQPKNSCYATKEAAEALLSRVYLYMEDWKNAAKYAENVINSGRFSLESRDRFSNYNTFVPEETTETIFAVRYTKDVDYPSAHRYYMIGSMYAIIDGDGWGGEMYASDSYLKLLELHPEDVRNNFIRKQSKNDGTYWFIYTEEVAGDDIETYVYRKQPVELLEDGTYRVVAADQDNYTNPVVQFEPYNGGTAAYLTFKNGGKTRGRVEEQINARDDFPRYYIYKCSIQEGQGHLWSPVISRLAEMYLNRAEARYHLKDESGALSDINQIRSRAGIPEWNSSNMPTDKTVLDLVLEERRLELAYEAQRRMDIYRTRGTLNRRYPGTHLLGASNTVRLEVPYTDPAVVEYIPQRELDAYPIPLEQNP
ncbi:MAG: RagB/SusD family nutrient uptake outer membrane protein [Tannerellaceae bacterium]|nr:RagB/SusD family nutrient uptake outer membrane protein [Tannerellaceae bacterium]